MKPIDSSPETGTVSKIKTVIETTYIPERDFSDRIMQRIDQMGSTSKAPRKTPVMTWKRAAIAICLVGLLSGFSYAASKWLDLRDKEGNTVMEVKKTDLQVPDWQNKVLDDVRKQIAPGESATVYFGSKEAITNKTTDNISGTTSPIEYLDRSTFIDGIQGPLANSHLTSHMPDGYQFAAGCLYMEPQNQSESSLIFARTEDGKDYAYYTRKPGSEIQLAALKYKNNGQEIRLSVLFVKGVEKPRFFVTNPSKDMIVNMNGTEAYYYDDTLHWAEKSADGFLSYTISGPAVTKEQLVTFAQVILAH
ncbi:hypothetical protein [Paenibacillus sp.]|jgi:hypothetical protein|uniref:hypothetical protein n=1 Tax=Paenibacillus sp. TaxID=58172 RepID=UPI00281A808E|nr:hypothetical protein [Paenibacillus sp.]MDR0270574.1 hypothetical protein [Paenibacillus sp.]